MKRSDKAARLTAELPGIKRGRGRPPLPDAKTPAQRQAEYRERQRQAIDSLADSVSELSENALGLRAARGAKEAWLALGRRYGWL